MSGPPTPVLDCPLLYLEIRDGVSARAYNDQSHGTFTLTIEGQRRVDADTGALIVLIRKQTQQVVSLRLAEVDSRSPGNMISINKQANRLCICVPGRPQAILVQFEKTRDFSVAVCLLQKAGFNISDALPASLLTNLPTHGTTPDYGPLLSSITTPSLFSLNTSRGPETQYDLSFGAMLAAPPQPSQLSPISQPWVSHTQRYMSVPVQPYPIVNQVVNVPPFAAQLNPYNMYLGGGNAYSHASSVSSPLGHSFVPNSPSTPWHDNDTGAFPDPNMPAPDFGMHESFVHGNIGSRNLENLRSNNVGSHIPNGLMQNGTTDGPANYQSPQNNPQEYRNLMPQPRTLPFESRKKGYKIGGKSDLKETKQLEAVKASKPRKTGKASHSNIGTMGRSPKKVRTRKIARKKANFEQLSSSERDTTPEKTTVQSGSNHKRADDASSLTPELKIPPKMSKQGTYEDAHCQTDMQSEPNGTDGSLKTAASIEQPTGHEATTMLFEEYEKRVEHCGDQVQHAESYSRRIWEKRRDFWLERLRDNTDVQWHSHID